MYFFLLFSFSVNLSRELVAAQKQLNAAHLEQAGLSRRSSSTNFRNESPGGSDLLRQRETDQSRAQALRCRLLEQEVANLKAVS